jgi:hypothetical protein
LSALAVSQVVRAHSGDVQECYRRAGIAYDRLKGRVSLLTTVDSDGNVVQARLSTNTEASAALEQCLVFAAKHWHFPALSGPPTFTSYRLVLE